MNKRIKQAVLCLGFLLASRSFAQPTVTIPDYLAPRLASQQVYAAASIRYEDESGHEMSATDFEARYRKSPGLDVAKNGADKLPDLTLRLIPPRPRVGFPFTRLEVGAPLPPFRLTRLDLASVDNKMLEGHYTLVSLYASNCAPCVNRVPVLNELARHRKNVQLLAITDDTAEQARHFATRYGLAWPAVADARQLIDQVGTKAYPTIALFDPDGKLVDAAAGRPDDLIGFIAWLDRKMGVVVPPVDEVPLPAMSPAVIDFDTCSRPAYPRSEYMAGHVGTTVLSFLIGVDGRVREMDVIKSSSHRRLDENAKAGLSQCRFKPAMRDGSPVENWMAVEYSWSLE